MRGGRDVSPASVMHFRWLELYAAAAVRALRCGRTLCTSYAIGARATELVVSLRLKRVAWNPVNAFMGHVCHIYDVRVIRGVCGVYHKSNETVITDRRKRIWFISFHRSNHLLSSLCTCRSLLWRGRHR